MLIAGIEEKSPGVFSGSFLSYELYSLVCIHRTEDLYRWVRELLVDLAASYSYILGMI